MSRRRGQFCEDARKRVRGSPIITSREKRGAGHSGRTDRRTEGDWCVCAGAKLGVSQQRRGPGKKRAEPQRRFGPGGAETYLQSPAALWVPALPPLHMPNLPPKPPRDLGDLALQHFIPLPRHLASPQINRVCELGGRGVWAHRLHRIHGGE